MKQAIQNEYLTTTGRLAVTTQTAYILFHYFDLCPEQFKERMTKDFYDKVISSGVHLQTGFVGTPYFAEALSKNGMNELAYGLLLNEDYPSWLFAVKMGATTIWERWNSILPDGKISGTDMNSLNHYAYGIDRGVAVPLRPGHSGGQQPAGVQTFLPGAATERTVGQSGRVLPIRFWPHRKRVGNFG